MSVILSKIKKRISSLITIRRIINTMKIISTTKLQYYKSLKNNITPYINSLKEVFENLDFELNNNIINDDYKVNDDYKNKSKRLFIIIGSNLGFCANYNDNILQYSLSKITKKDKIIPIGFQSLFFLKNLNLNLDIDDSYFNLNQKINLKNIEIFAKKILKKYFAKKYSEINIIFMENLNNFMKDSIKNIKLLPVKNNNNNNKLLLPIVEINQKVFFDEIVPIYFSKIIYQIIIEAQISEHFFRKITTENAIKNTDKILNELQNEFNKIKQKSITQEIMEIIAGQIYG